MARKKMLGEHINMEDIAWICHIKIKALTISLAWAGIDISMLRPREFGAAMALQCEEMPKTPGWIWEPKANYCNHRLLSYIIP